MAARSPIPDLCLRVLYTEPVGANVPVTTTAVQQAVARLGHNVTRDTIAKHLRRAANADTPLVERYGRNIVGPDHAWRLTLAGRSRVTNLALQET